MLVRSRLKALPPHRDFSDLEERPVGCFRHQHGPRGRRCELCPRLKEGRTFESNFTGRKYEIRHYLTCKSKYCVYLITCKNCRKQYTGKSINYMHTRHSGHRSEIEHESSELGIHFARCGIEHLELQIIDCVDEGKDMALLHLEGVWQNRLATFRAHGNINVRNELTANRSTANFF